MGKAWRAPDTNRGFKHHISTHAVEQFRQRVEQQHRHRSDDDLARLLDERITNAVKAGCYSDVNDIHATGVITRVVEIESHSGLRFSVTMRPYVVTLRNKPGAAVWGPSTNGLVAITVLTKEMADVYYANRTWTLVERNERTPLVDRPFAVALQSVSLPAPTPPPCGARAIA